MKVEGRSSDRTTSRSRAPSTCTPSRRADIPSVVEEYVRAAHEAGLREVRLIHGRGTGVQRGIVQAALERHPLVETLPRRARVAPGGDGGGADAVGDRGSGIGDRGSGSGIRDRDRSETLAAGHYFGGCSWSRTSSVANDPDVPDPRSPIPDPRSPIPDLEHPGNHAPADALACRPGRPRPAPASAPRARRGTSARCRRPRARTGSSPAGFASTKPDVREQVAEIDRVPDEPVHAGRDHAAVGRAAGRSCGRATACRARRSSARCRQIATRHRLGRERAAGHGRAPAAGRTSRIPVSSRRLHERSTDAGGPPHQREHDDQRSRWRASSRPVTCPVPAQSFARRYAIDEKSVTMMIFAARSPRSRAGAAAARWPRRARPGRARRPARV